MTEQQIHKAVVKHLRQRSTRGVWFAHIPNGGYRRKKEAAIFNGLGVQAGAPDLILIKNGQARGLELKAPKGKLSNSQVETHLRMAQCGCPVHVAFGLDDAIAWLESSGYLQGRASA